MIILNIIKLFAAILSGYLAYYGYIKKDTNLILIALFILICIK